jgi:hypothetical protein
MRAVSSGWLGQVASVVSPLAGEPNRVAIGDDDAGVVQEPVDGDGGEALGHDRVEPAAVEIGGDRNGAAFLGGDDVAVEGFGGDLAGAGQDDARD